MIEALIIHGILTGAFYALVALGFSMVWASMKVINIAHCVFTLVSSYVAWVLFQLYGIDPFITIALMIPSMFAAGIITYKFLIKHFYRSPRYEEVSVVATFGIALALQNCILLIFGANQKGIYLPYIRYIEIWTTRVSNIKIIATVLAITATYIIYLIVNKSYFGKSVRASWQHEAAAIFCGVNINHVRMITFGLALSTTALPGGLIPVIYVASPHIHWLLLVYTFLVVIIGGVGSIKGSIVAGFMIGLIDALGTMVIPTAWVPIILFGLFIVLLLLRPTGLFGGNT